MDKPWTLNYIEDAATVRRTIRRADGSVFTHTASNYDPPNNGVHLCGITDDERQPTTVAAYRMGPGEAIIAWYRAKAVAECEKEAADFVINLCVDGVIEDDFWTNRQLWPRAIAAWNDGGIAQPTPESPNV